MTMAHCRDLKDLSPVKHLQKQQEAQPQWRGVAGRSAAVIMARAQTAAAVRQKKEEGGRREGDEGEGDSSDEKKDETFAALHKAIDACLGKLGIIKNKKEEARSGEGASEVAQIRASSNSINRSSCVFEGRVDSEGVWYHVRPRHRHPTSRRQWGNEWNGTRHRQGQPSPPLIYYAALQPSAHSKDTYSHGEIGSH